MRWRDAPPILAYDDADIRVVFQPGGSDVLLVTFGDAQMLADGLRIAADELVRKHGFACLGFMAHHANWFPAEAVARALPSIAYTLRSFRRVMAYGCSMGAYAAIKHSRALGATDVLALGPQWSIDPAECAFGCGYHGFYRPRMAGMGIRAADIAGRIALLYDPGHALDRNHADAIAARATVTRVHVPSADHHLAPMLAGSDCIAGLMQAWLQDDIGAVYRMLAARRRPSPVRIRILLARAVLRHPALALRAMDLLARSGRLGLVEADLHLIPLLQTLLTHGRTALAARALEIAGGVLTPMHARILMKDLGSAGTAKDGGTVRTAHGTNVFYDSVTGTLQHRPSPATANEAFGLHAASLAPGAPDAAPLLVSIRGTAMACTRDAGGRLTLVCDPLPGIACVRVARLDSASFALAIGTDYLCASPDGQLFSDRTEINSWEVFTII